MSENNKFFPIRKALLERKVTIGSWVQAAHPANCEVLANAGFDWVALESEHSENDVREFADFARAMYGRNAAPLVRVRESDPLVIRRLLDMGAHGVIVPMVESAEEAQKVVNAAKYPPEGKRGYCMSRMNDWGVDFDEYLQEANDLVAVIVMIESKEGVQNVDEILAVPGVDGVFIGPYDLTGSYGIPGQVNADVIVEARKTVLEACRKAGKAAGIHVVLPTEEAIRDIVNEGFTFICLASDIIFMNEAARQWRAMAVKAAE